MYDTTVADQLYDAGMSTLGTPPGADLFNKAVAFPLSHLPQAVLNETGEQLPGTRLRNVIRLGWIPEIPATEQPDEPGFALYLPSRVGLFLRLEREGYDPAELRSLAEYEEAVVDDILTADELEYVDDDRELLIRSAREHAQMLREHLDRAVQHGGGFGHWGSAEAIQHEIEQTTRFADRLEATPWNRLSGEAQYSLGRKAYRVRLHNDMLRLHMIETDRAKVRMGYSPTITFEEWGGMLDSGFHFERIRWDWTLSAPFDEETDARPWRVPGFILRGDQIVTSQTLTPSRYRELWEENQLDRYLEVHAEIASSRICEHCRQPLPEDADPRRRYCNTRCRDRARQKKYRERHPRRILESQQRYWSS